jgi:hypothetical protein
MNYEDRPPRTGELPSLKGEATPFRQTPKYGIHISCTEYEIWKIFTILF